MHISFIHLYISDIINAIGANIVVPQDRRLEMPNYLTTLDACFVMISSTLTTWSW